MKCSRFKFRVWDEEYKDYLPEGVLLDGRTGNVSGVNVDRYVIEQCTGLKDKNGKLIYEGDVLVGSWSTKLIVFWDVISSSYRVKPLEDKCGEREIHYYTVIATLPDGSIECINYEIIGNIHEMEGEK